MPVGADHQHLRPEKAACRLSVSAASPSTGTFVTETFTPWRARCGANSAPATEVE